MTPKACAVAQRAAAEATHSLQKILSQLPGMVYLYRMHPDGSSCFPYASDAIRRLFRLDPEEVRADASKALNCIHPDDYEEVMASIQKSAADLTLWQQEYRVKFADAELRWQLGNALPERESDGATLWHGFVSDITERKAAESARTLEAGHHTLGRVPAHLHELPETVTQGMVADKKAVKFTSRHTDKPAQVVEQSLHARGAPKLPVGASPVQLVPGRYKTVANAIMATTSPLQYNALMRSIALASGQFGLEGSSYVDPKGLGTAMADEARRDPLLPAQGGDAP